VSLDASLRMPMVTSVIDELLSLLLDLYLLLANGDLHTLPACTRYLAAAGRARRRKR
jgi:hypothetical protein